MYIKFKELPIYDYDRAIDFYTNKLGFVVDTDVPYGDADGRWVELKINGKDTGLLLQKASDSAEKDRTEEKPNLVITVEDLADYYSKLTEKGVLFTAELQEAPWSVGNLFAMLKDSEGNKILLTTDK